MLFIWHDIIDIVVTCGVWRVRARALLVYVVTRRYPISGENWKCIVLYTTQREGARVFSPQSRSSCQSYIIWHACKPYITMLCSSRVVHRDRTRVWCARRRRRLIKRVISPRVFVGGGSSSNLQDPKTFVRIIIIIAHSSFIALS